VEAFIGRFSDHHAFLLTTLLSRIDALTDIDAVQERTEDHLAPFADAVARLDEIPGIGPTAAAVIIAEISVDMTRFPTPGRLSSWAKFAPGVKESAGRKKGNGPPGTATVTWHGSAAKQQSTPDALTPSWASATNLSLPRPDTKRLRVDPELVTDPGTRPRTAHRVLAGVQSHPDSSLSQLLPPVQENVMQMYLRSESSG
jgi:hypothetical protein